MTGFDRKPGGASLVDPLDAESVPTVGKRTLAADGEAADGGAPSDGSSLSIESALASDDAVGRARVLGSHATQAKQLGRLDLDARSSAAPTAAGRTEPTRASPARAGRVINISLGQLVEGTKLTPGIVRLVQAMARDRISVGAPPSGLAQLEAVFAAEDNQAKLRTLTKSSNPSAWLATRMTAVIPTREHEPGGGPGAPLVNRSPAEIVQAIVGYLETHPGAKVLIDEVAQGRFELVRDVARTLSAKQYRHLRGRWGSYISAKPGGIKNGKRIRGALEALRGAGASAVLEGYGAGVNRWQDRKARLREGKQSLGLLRRYIANPGYAVGSDAKRVGVDLQRLRVDGRPSRKIVALEHRIARTPAAQRPPLQQQLAQLRTARRAQLQRIFLARLHHVFADAGRMLPGVDRSSWVSRLEGGAADDAAEIRALLG